MSKNILILTGSPRKNGNTKILTDAFITGAQEAGHTVSIFNVAENTVKPCIACDKCFTVENKPCVFNDSFNDLANLLTKNDVLVFATPLYWFGFSAQLKSAIDKFYSLVSRSVIEAKETVLLTVGACTDDKDFEPLVKNYEAIANYLKLENKGVIIAKGAYGVGEVNNSTALSEAKTLGQSL